MLTTRRAVLAGAGVLVGRLAMPRLARAADAVPERSPQFEAAYARLVGDEKFATRAVKLELPDLAENGNMVPYTVTVDSPMTEAAHVETITLLSTGNPQPVIATFYLGPLSGRASVSGRLRLARTQTVFAIARLNTGELIQATARTEVTVGGCGAG